MNEFKISIDPQKWGLNTPADIRHHIQRMKSVLESASSQIARNCVADFMPDILVEKDKEGPVCHHAKDNRGRVRIGLDITYGDSCQQAYQFAHEFCHAVANHTRDGQEHNLTHQNKWFEEAICHTASFFVLQQMSKEWSTDSQFKSWVGPNKSGKQQPFFEIISTYSQGIIEKAMSSLPLSEDFVSWFTQCESELRGRPIAIEKDKTKDRWLRNCFNVIAIRLLPLFENTPTGWTSVIFLNLTPTSADNSLSMHLANWKKACPDHLQSFVCNIALIFGIPLA